MATKKILANLELDGSITSSTFNIGSSGSYIGEDTGDTEIFADSLLLIESGDGMSIEVTDVIDIIGGGEITADGSIEAVSFIKTGGTSSQFLKADGSVDSSTYLTSADVTSSQWDAATGGINYAGGNVGIGTTSPDAKLDVAGAAIIGSSSGTGTLTIGNTISNSGSMMKMLGYTSTYKNWQLGNGLPTGGVFSITPSTTNGGTVFTTPSFVIDTNNNVGIGITDPTGKLELDGGDFIINNDHLIKSKNSANYIDIYKAANASMRFKMGHATVGRFQFLNNADTEVFTIDARNERVGIGVTAPSANLHVKASNSGASTHAGTLIVEAGSAPSVQILSANNQTQSIKFGDPEDGDVGGITYSHGTNEMQFRINGGSKMTIDSGGQMGIGTTDPDVMLDVSTSTYANAFVPIQDLKYSTFDVMKLGYTGLTGSIRKGTIDTATYGFSINTGDGSERLAIDTSGDVVIGGNTTSASFIKSGGASTEFLKADGSVDTNTYLTSADISGDYLLNTTDTLTGRLTVTSSVRVGDDTAAATSANVGALRYREETGFSYVDMCMKTDNSSWGWVNIVKNIFSV